MLHPDLRIDGLVVHNTLLDTVLHTLSLLGAPVMRSMLLLFLYSGFSNGFWSGVLTEQLSTDSIGLAMVVVGVAEVLGGLCYGKLVVSYATALFAASAMRDLKTYLLWLTWINACA